MPPVACNIPWTESPFFSKELAQSALCQADKELVRRYAEDGYLVIETEIDASVFDLVAGQLEAKFSRARQKHAGNHHDSHRLLDAWRYNQAVKTIATNKRIMDLLQLLYRRKPIPFQSLNFDVGTQQRTHSDMIHFSSIPERYMCGVWIALEDVTLENGPLHYYPGSHLLPFYTMADLGVKPTQTAGAANPYEAYEAVYEDFIEQVVQCRQLKKEVLLVRKGQAIIWAANLLHGGEPIRAANSTRHSQVTHYFFEDCSYYTPLFTDFLLGQVHLRTITDISTGQPVPNRYLGKELEAWAAPKARAGQLWKRLLRPVR